MSNTVYGTVDLTLQKQKERRRQTTREENLRDDLGVGDAQTQHRGQEPGRTAADMNVYKNKWEHF